MMSFALKFSTTLVGKKPTTTWPKLCTWPWIVSVESPPSSRWTPSPGWNTKPRPSASTTARALLSSSQKIERRPMLRSFARPPSERIDETIATRISGATVASRMLM